MRKMDEMEMSIALQSYRYSYALGMILLFIYNMYFFFTNKSFNKFTWIIMLLMSLFQQGLYTYKMSKMTSQENYLKNIILIFSNIILIGLFLVIY